MNAEFDDDAINKPSVTPLSLFFPEITEEESLIIDGETVVIMERRAKVMLLYRRGWTMKRIANEIPCAPSTVHLDIHTVLDGYKRIAGRAAQEHIADALQRISAREADIEKEWERSKGDVTETAQRRKRVADNEADDYATVKKKERFGDPRLAALLIQCWDRRCKLLGLLKDIDLKNPLEFPPCKLVKGIDPVELVQ